MTTFKILQLNMQYGQTWDDADPDHAPVNLDLTLDEIRSHGADIVLLEHDLGVVAQGVRLGRQTFANTLKYVFITTSANFGNMVSMAGASLCESTAARSSPSSGCR